MNGRPYHHDPQPDEPPVLRFHPEREEDALPASVCRRARGQRPLAPQTRTGLRSETLLCCT
ncbi:hypothetical protein E2C01_093390 [Portunus trituberculatus]|uniref:Uncharacterized protein n=1 Tax=Portunus trituberculatus TaxID=210409 RepID=A0A5B7JML6_PORTR|nr:hypothetical protein [Portunus trituberculatus]